MKRPKVESYGVEQDAAGQEPTIRMRGEYASTRFSVRAERNVQVVLLSRSDVLDAFYIEQLGDELKKFVGTLDRPRVVINLENVTHFSSAALGMMVMLKSLVEGNRGKLALANVDDNIRQVFKLTRLDKVLKIQDDVRTAVKSIS